MSDSPITTRADSTESAELIDIFTRFIDAAATFVTIRELVSGDTRRSSQ